RDPGRRYDPAWNDQAEGLGLVINVAPCGAAFGPHDAARSIDAHAAAQAHIDHQAAIAERVTGDVVTAAPDRQRQAVLAREVYAGNDVGIAAHPGKQRRPPRDHSVPDHTRFAVSWVGGLQQRTTQRLAKRGDHGLIQLAVGLPDENIGHGSLRFDAMTKATADRHIRLRDCTRQSGIGTHRTGLTRIKPNAYWAVGRIGRDCGWRAWDVWHRQFRRTRSSPTSAPRAVEALARHRAQCGPKQWRSSLQDRPSTRASWSAGRS